MKREPMQKIGLFLMSVVLVSLIRCAGSFRTTMPLPEMNPERLLNQVHVHASQLVTFQGIAHFNIASQEGSFYGTLKVVMKSPDSLWMKIQGPLGVSLAVIRFGGDNALVYSPWENVVYQGSLADISEMDLLPSGFWNSSQFMLGMTGLLVPDFSMLDSLAEFTSEDERYLLVERNGEQYWIEPKGPVVTKWERCDSTGHPFQKWEGKSFKKRKGIRSPQQILFANRYPEQRVTLQYDEIKMNKPLRKGWFGIHIPEGAQKIELGYKTSFE
jgi:hypothetical protein